MPISRRPDEDTIVIAGHGKPVGNRAELQAFRDMLVAIRDNVAAPQEAGTNAGRDRRGKADRGLRRQMGATSSSTPASSPGWSTKGV